MTIDRYRYNEGVGPEEVYSNFNNIDHSLGFVSIIVRSFLTMFSVTSWFAL